MSTSRSVVLTILVSSLPSILLGQNISSEPSRVIDFDARVPIANRLLPQDRIVEIKKNSFPPLISMNSGLTLDQAIDDAMVHDVVLVAHVNPINGTLIDQGAWVRGNAEAEVIEFIKSGPIATNTKRLRLWHDNGETFVNHVLVRAGVYPVFARGQRHLLLLGVDPMGELFLSRGFQVTKNGTIGALMLSNREMELHNNPMRGQPEQRVLTLFRRRGSKQ